MNFILLLIFIWSLGMCTDIRLLGYSFDSPWYTLFTFSYVHVSFIHLLINSCVFICYWRSMKGLINMKLLIPMIFFIPAVSAYFSASSVPTVGASSIIMVLMGIYLTMPIPKKVIREIWILTIISFVVTFIFAPQINTLIHIYSLLLSYVISLLAGRRIYA